MEWDVQHMWEQMGIAVKATTVFMGILSVYSVYRIVERFVLFNAATKQSYSYVLLLRDFLSKRRIDEALKAARSHQRSPVAKVVESGLIAFKTGREALESQGP